MVVIDNLSLKKYLLNSDRERQGLPAHKGYQEMFRDAKLNFNFEKKSIFKKNFKFRGVWNKSCLGASEKHVTALEIAGAKLFR